MPMTFSGRDVADAIFVIEIEEVFDARMADFLTILSKDTNNSLLTDMFSTMALKIGWLSLLEEDYLNINITILHVFHILHQSQSSLDSISLLLSYLSFQDILL